MRTKPLLKLILVVALIVGTFIFAIMPLATSIRQGLDLQGGTHVVLQAEDTAENKVTEDAMNRVIKIMELRVNALGLTEPIIQREGRDRVIIELPGIKDPDKAIAILGKTAMLEFKDENGKTILTGNDLEDAREQTTQNGQNEVALKFNDEGSQKFADATSQNVGKIIYIMLDGKELTAPRVQQAITGGNAVITGSRSLEEAHNLAVLLRSGALPVKVEIVETRTVGPTLGQDSKEKSIFAFEIGLGAVFLFMVLFYRASGVIADISLMAYIILLLSALKLLDATLTLPGVAGIILSIGMAVDANVLIFEHFKEEVRHGKTLRSAIESGFKRAFTTIFDSNLTTLIAAGVLLAAGTGPIKGFAITLGLGVLISMFTAITLTQFMIKNLIGANIVSSPFFYGATKPKLDEQKKGGGK